MQVASHIALNYNPVITGRMVVDTIVHKLNMYT